MQQMWFSQAVCQGCNWKVQATPDLGGVADKAKEHRHETRHVVDVTDEKRSV